MSVAPDDPRPPSLLLAIIPITLFMLVAGVVGPIFLFMGLAIDDEPGTEWLLPTGIGITILDIVIGVLIGLGRYRSQVKRYRLGTSGRSAMAEVLEVSPTNIEINDQPLMKLRLRIHGPDITPFEVEDKQVVPEYRLPFLAAAEVPVLVDPETREWEFDWDKARRPAASAVAPVAVEPAAPADTRTAGERLTELDDLLRRDLIGREEYDEARARIIADL